MKKVTVYESSDGKQFKTKSECVFHERYIALCDSLDKDLYLRDVSSEDIADWLIKNGYFR